MCGILLVGWVLLRVVDSVLDWSGSVPILFFLGPLILAGLYGGFASPLIRSGLYACLAVSAVAPLMFMLIVAYGSWGDMSLLVFLTAMWRIYWRFFTFLGAGFLVGIGARKVWSRFGLDEVGKGVEFRGSLLVPVVVFFVLVCLLYVSSFRVRDPWDPGIRLDIDNLVVDRFENGTTSYGGEDIPVHMANVSLDLVNRGSEVWVGVVVSLVYYDHASGTSPLTSHSAAPDQKFEVHLEPATRTWDPDDDGGDYVYSYVREHLETCFDIGRIAPLLHDGEAHLSTLAARVYVLDDDGNIIEEFN